MVDARLVPASQTDSATAPSIMTVSMASSLVVFFYQIAELSADADRHITAVIRVPARLGPTAWAIVVIARAAIIIGPAVVRDRRSDGQTRDASQEGIATTPATTAPATTMPTMAAMPTTTAPRTCLRGDSGHTRPDDGQRCQSGPN